jgi:hypothetical protein
LSKSPEDRFPSADQFREALRRGLAGLPMETLSGVSIPPELVATTPPGTLPLPGTIPSLSMPPPTPTSPGATSRGTTSSTSSNPSARLPLTPTAAAAASKTQPVPGRAAGAKTPPNLIAIALGAFVVLTVLLSVLWFRSHRAATPAAPVDTVASTPTPTPPSPSPTPAESAAPAETPPTTPQAAASPGATPTPTTSNAPRAGSPPPAGPAGSTIPAPPAAGTTGAAPTGSPTASPGTSGRAASPTPTPRPASPAIDAAPVVFNDVKYIRIQGDKGDDEDARLIFGGGVIQVLPRNKDQAFTAEPYRRLARATYVRAKNPKWDPSLAGPLPSIDLSGFWRGTRHWLVLQSKTTFVILRLDDSNWQTILDTFESRTGIKVDRPPSTDK